MNELWITIVVLLIILLVCREITCWYLKQTEQVKLLKEIRDALVEKKPGVIENFKAGLNEKACPYCGTGNLPSSTNCLKCGNSI